MLDFLELLGGNSLTRLVLFPALASLPLLLAKNDRGLRWYLLSVSLLELGFGCLLLIGQFDAAGALRPLREVGPDGAVLSWIPSLGVSWDLGLDGISLPLSILVLIILPISILASWNHSDLHWPSFGAILLLTATATLGASLSIDIFLFFVFWEALLLPLAFWIGRGGHRDAYPDRWKLLLVALVADVFMMLAALRLATEHLAIRGSWSFASADLLAIRLPPELEIWLFVAFVFAFAARASAFPLHLWLPDTLMETPIVGALWVITSGLCLGSYGILRFALPLFPSAGLLARPYLVALAVAGMLLGGLSAWTQTDLRRLLAYGSICHLSLVLLGIFTLDRLAWEGAVFHVFHLGLTMSALLLLVGMIHERLGKHEIDGLVGFARHSPKLTIVWVAAAMALAGAPLLSGFVGEVAILTGTYRSLLTVTAWIPLAATAGLLATTLYLVRLISRPLFPARDADRSRHFADLLPREILTLAPLLILILILGLAPELLLRKTRPALENSHQRMSESLRSDGARTADSEKPDPGPRGGRP